MDPLVVLILITVGLVVAYIIYECFIVPRRTHTEDRDPDA